MVRKLRIGNGLYLLIIKESLCKDQEEVYERNNL